MATGTMVFETVDDFPTTTRPGSGNKGPRETDVDIALKAYRDGGAVGVLKLLDYNEAPVLDGKGEPTVDASGQPVTETVDEATARSRASGRVAPLKGRGYAIEDGWVVVARNGAVYAKFYGVGGVPAEFIRKTKPVGEEIAV